MTKPPAASTSISGGCFCGAVRYEISGPPVFELMCYCKDCLTFSGTDGYAGLMVETSKFKVVRGEPSVFE